MTHSKLKAWAGELKKIANSVSTKPNTVSWKWKGGTSLIAFCLLYLIYVGRLLSLLQWIKYLYRVLVRRYGRVSVDRASKRVNVPSVLVEIYFLAWMALLFCLPSASGAAKALSVYFIAESYIWILYYYFFRRFFEERYAIMHTLEYIVILPVLITSQALGVANIEGQSLTGALDMILNPFEFSPLYVVLLSVLYSAIIFGLIISNLPVERVKEKGNYKFNYAVIGYGDIVQKRLLTALSRLKTANLVAVFDKAFTKSRPASIQNKHVCISFFPIHHEFDKLVLSSCIVWIATPSYAHISYLSRFAPDVKFLVLEKPVTSIKSEFETAKRLIGKFQPKIFCLSYYYLEKALPLTFLYNPLFFYEKYLDFNGAEREQILAAFSNLGKVEFVELCLFEGEDNREWLTDMQYGGQFLETFIHPAMILKMIVGPAAALTDCRWELGDSHDKVGTYVGCRGRAGTVEFDLKMGKFYPDSKRGGVIKCERGSIGIDFEKQLVTLEMARESYTLSTNARYGKYEIQLDMVDTCFSEGILPSMVDGSDLQMATLDWLFSVDLSRLSHFKY